MLAELIVRHEDKSRIVVLVQARMVLLFVRDEGGSFRYLQRRRRGTKRRAIQRQHGVVALHPASGRVFVI